MKKLLLVIICLIFPVILLSDSSKIQPKKFKVTYTIIYNSMTLEEASKKEMEIRNKFKGACKVNVMVEEPNFTVDSTGDSLIYFYSR